MAEKLTPRKQQALEMRSRIQNVALDLFDREGFENVSVEEIAQKAGCSVGKINHTSRARTSWPFRSPAMWTRRT